MLAKIRREKVGIDSTVYKAKIRYDFEESCLK